MKIALYLGSFNPFHNGHLNVVDTAFNDFKIDKVVIVPTMQNPWKKEKVLDIDKRLEIIIRTVLHETNYLDFDDENEENNPIIISLIEKELIPPYYSYATLHALKNKYCNDEVFILVGSDTMKDIPNWMNGEAIIQDYNFLIVDRPKNSISSSSIRKMIKEDKYINPYVSPNVINLIRKYYK